MENNESIKPNDLVVVYKPCHHCGSNDGMGHIFHVSKVAFWPNSKLDCCDATDDIFAVDSDTQIGYTIWCVKKIPPLDEPELVDEKEDLPLLQTIE